MMHLKEAEARIEALEQDVANLKQILQLNLEKKRVLTSFDKTDRVTIKIGSKKSACSTCETDNAILVKTKEYVHLVASSLLIDSPLVNINGQLSAQISYSKPFTWRQGQRRVRMYHSRKGFPVLTGVSADVKSDQSVSFLLYIDTNDRHWYLEGKEQAKEVSAIFIGLC